MNKKSVDEWLSLAGEKMEIDGLSAPCAYHHFSESYEERKRRLRRQVRQCGQAENPEGRFTARRTKSIRPMFRRWAAAAAAFVLVFGVSVTAYAYFKNLHMDVAQNNNIVDIQIREFEDGDSSGVTASLSDLPEEGISVPVLRLNAGYVPAGYVSDRDDSSAHINYYAGGEYGGAGFFVMQNTFREVSAKFVENYETRTIGNMEAVIMYPQKTDADQTYMVMILLLNKEDMVSLIVGSDDPALSMDELIKIAENVTYTTTDEAVMAYADPQNEYAAVFDTFYKSQVVDVIHMDFASAFDGEIVDEADQIKADVRVKDVVLKDDVNGLEKDDFVDSDRFWTAVNGSGQIADLRIPLIQNEDGVSANAGEADRKLLLVTLEIENTGDVDMTQFSLNSYLAPGFFADAGDGTLHMTERATYADEPADSEWCYLDSSDYTSDEETRAHSFFCVDIPAKTTRTVTLGWMVYSDELDLLYLTHNPHGAVLGNEDCNPKTQLIDLSAYIQ